jgi:hypothetical protein
LADQQGLDDAFENAFGDIGNGVALESFVGDDGGKGLASIMFGAWMAVAVTVAHRSRAIVEGLNSYINDFHGELTSLWFL